MSGNKLPRVNESGERPGTNYLGLINLSNHALELAFHSPLFCWESFNLEAL